MRAVQNTPYFGQKTPRLLFRSLGIFCPKYGVFFARPAWRIMSTSADDIESADESQESPEYSVNEIRSIFYSVFSGLRSILRAVQNTPYFGQKIPRLLKQSLGIFCPKNGVFFRILRADFQNTPCRFPEYSVRALEILRAEFREYSVKSNMQ